GLADVLGKLDLVDRPDLDPDEPHRRPHRQPAGILEAGPVPRPPGEQSPLLADRHDAQGEENQPERDQGADADLLGRPREPHSTLPFPPTGNAEGGGPGWPGPPRPSRRSPSALRTG